ncbi:MAG: DUF885 domain-containing protein [Promicromonosporaceae bacterium]|nr:DUF885 domain-containing protein [Promicromonosporaceae bacterium]
MTTPTPRPKSPIDAVADAYVARYLDLDPWSATQAGVPGYDHLWPDFSPEGAAERVALDRATLAELAECEPVDDVDRVTLASMRERLGLAGELHDADLGIETSLNNLASPVQGVRDIFDLMSTDTTEGWVNVAARLNSMPEAVAGYIESLKAAAARGNVAAIRQVSECARQAQLQTGDDSFFPSFVAGADASLVSDGLRVDLERGIGAAKQAYATLADFLERDLAPQAPQVDAVGREKYALCSRQFLGAAVDLDETYEWGMAELAKIMAEQTAVAEQIAGPGASVEQAVTQLEADEKYILRGTDALKAWMQATSDKAIEELSGTHFNIEGPMRTLECLIAPTNTGAIYYTGPSDDFSRPGRMWWSVPAGQDTFGTWREKTTVYHEGVPGHHLQIAASVANKEMLNDWRRMMCWISGHGEGWALYAEQLMAELGYLDDPADRLGMLDGQRLRAARVVFDIGMHLEKKAPVAWGGEVWTPETSWNFLKSNVNMNEDLVKFEYTRYLGWPGQAPAYKVGQRIWEQVRAEAEATAGAAFDAKAYHTKALNLGAVPLSVLRNAIMDAL